MSLTNNVPGRRADEAIGSRSTNTISFRITLVAGRGAEAVAEDTSPGGVKTRPELTVPISGGPALPDTVLYEDPAVPDRDRQHPGTRHRHPSSGIGRKT
jgi:hypothetical protein